MALAQCTRFFRHRPWLEPVQAHDTAGAVAHMMASAARDTAAIASRRAAEIYGATVLHDGIQDRCDNVTRFVTLFRASPQSRTPPWSPAAPKAGSPS